MADLGPAIKALDLEEIAQLLERMKRLWVGKNLAGLLRRRDAEAALVRGSHRKYSVSDTVQI